MDTQTKGEKMKKLMVIAALLVFMTGSVAYAADWNFYGSARVNTTYTKFDNDMFADATKAALFGRGSGPDTSNFEQRLYGSARIGAKVKVSDSVTGRFEFGALGAGGEVNVRILWGEWNFGAGSLGVGQNYTPLLFPYSNQTYSINGFNKGDHNMSTFGMLYGSRKPMIRLKFGGFQLAFVEPRARVYYEPTTAGVGGAPAGWIATAQPSTEVMIPSIQAKYKYDFDSGHISLAGGYQTFDVINGTNEYSVNSYILGLGGRVNFGGVYLKGNVWGGQNVGNMADILVSSALFSTTTNAGAGDFDGDGWGYASYNDGSLGGTAGIIDRDALACLIVAGYEIRKGLYIEAGYGYVKTELDAAASTKDDAETVYLQSTIFLAPGVFLTPEIGQCDMKQANQPVVRYAGIKWQINF